MNARKLAVHGGTPVRTRPYPSWPPVTATARTALTSAFDDGVWGDVAGERKLRFERDFASAHGARHALAVSNGTVSLQIALSALGVGSGAEVIVPGYTFLATATAVLAVNATPVFVDVHAATGTIDTDAVEAAITERTAAIIPVHFGGQPADMDALVDISHRTGIPLVEDAAQAHGARWRQEPVGSMGSFGSFSFQASKNMTAGEGGALTTNDDALAERAWSLHHCGRVRGRPWYHHELDGGNHRMTEFQAAILIDQLAHLEALGDRRARAAEFLTAALSEVDGIEPLAVDARVGRHAFHVYGMRFDAQSFGGDRDSFLEAVRAEGVPISGGYISPLHRQPVFAERRFDVGAVRVTQDYASLQLPESERLCAEMAMLPQYVLLGDESDLGDVVEAITKVRATAGELR